MVESFIGEDKAAGHVAGWLGVLNDDGKSTCRGVFSFCPAPHFKLTFFIPATLSPLRHPLSRPPLVVLTEQVLFAKQAHMGVWSSL